MRNNSATHSKEHLQKWWLPLLDMKLDDATQEPPYWVGTNNLVLNTPFPGIQIKAFASIHTSDIGVFLSGTRVGNVFVLQEHLASERVLLLKEFPKGTRIEVGGRWPIFISNDAFKSDDKKRAWIAKTMNDFANVLRPRLRKWYRATRG